MESEGIAVMDSETFIEAVLSANRRFQGQVWWRGQSISTWTLSPSVARLNRGHRYEQNMILRFMQRAPARHPKTPGPTDISGWLFLMQHYRLPTRLLDWTESPLTACFFSVDLHQHPNDDGALYALSPYALNYAQVQEYAVLTPAHPKAFAAVRHAFNDDVPDVNYTVGLLPSEADVRMMVQLSVFTVHGSAMDLEGLPNRHDFLMKFEVPATAKPLLAEQLKTLGVRESALFPDLEHLASETKGLHFVPPSQGPGVPTAQPRAPNAPLQEEIDTPP